MKRNFESITALSLIAFYLVYGIVIPQFKNRPNLEIDETTLQRIECVSDEPKCIESNTGSSPWEREYRSSPSDVYTQELGVGSMAWLPPKEIDIESTEEILLLVDMTKSIDELQKTLKEKRDALVGQINMADHMTASLTGSQFQITPITPEERFVSFNSTEKWKWEVTPKKEGAHKLHLTITIDAIIDGKKGKILEKVFSREILIFPTRLYKARLFLDKNYQWILTTILLPFAIWAWSRRKKAAPESTLSPTVKS